MRPRLWLVIAAAVLGGVHVLGVLLGRSLFRPAELLATLCLLGFAILYTSRPVAAATAVLAIEAALTVPPPPIDTEAGWQILSPEEYSGAAWRSLAESSAPSVAALIFTIVLLVAQRPLPRPDRRILLPAVAAAILVIGYLALRLTEVVVDAGRASAGPGQDSAVSPAAVAWRVGLATLLPLLLALTALTLAALSAARGSWAGSGERGPGPASWAVTLGAVLLAVAALPWIDAMIAAVPLPYALYAVGGDTALFSSAAFTPSVLFLQPMPAATAALQVTAYLLIVTGSAGRDS